MILNVETMRQKASEDCAKCWSMSAALANALKVVQEMTVDLTKQDGASPDPDMATDIISNTVDKKLV